jgi:7-carboxy-7-deazaguanine synthase
VSVHDHPPAAGYLSELFASYQGEGARAGERHLFVRFAGCNIRCRYCDTPGSLERVADCTVDYPDGSSEVIANPIGAQQLAAIVRRFCEIDPAIALIAITGGEPMLQHRFIRAWLGEHRPPVGCLLETNALISEGLDALLPYVAVVSADIKLPSNSGEGARWNEHRRFFERCRPARFVPSDIHPQVYVKMPVDDRTTADDVREGARLVAQTLPGAPLYLQPLTDPVSGDWRLSHPRLLSLLRTATAEVPGTRFRPQLHKLVGMR